MADQLTNLPPPDNTSASENPTMIKLLSQLNFEKLLREFGVPTAILSIFVSIVTIFGYRTVSWTGQEVVLPMRDAHTTFLKETITIQKQQAITDDKTAAAMSTIADSVETQAETQEKILSIIETQADTSSRNNP